MVPCSILIYMTSSEGRTSAKDLLWKQASEAATKLNIKRNSDKFNINETDCIVLTHLFP